MTDLLFVHPSIQTLNTRIDSLVSLATQEQIRLQEANQLHQNQYYLLCAVFAVALFVVFLLLRWRISSVGDEQQKKMKDVLSKIEQLEQACQADVDRQDGTLKPKVIKPKRSFNDTLVCNQQVSAAEKEDVLASLASPNTIDWVVKYGNMQAPDSEGVLRIAERSISDVSSALKMFKLSYCEGGNEATYTINPDAKGAILQDIQTFQMFTEPSMLIGSAQPTRIDVEQEGTLMKTDKFWVVKSRMKVKFN